MENSESEYEDYLSDKDSDAVLSNDEDDEEYEENEEPITGDRIYPEFKIKPDSINPDTKKRWTTKEINAKYKEQIESRWSKEQPPAPHKPFVYKSASPGPVGIEETALAVFERFMNRELVTHLVDASNEYGNSERYKKRRKREGSFCDIVTERDFYIWLALNILCAIHGKQDIKNNWSRSASKSRFFFCYECR
jgi:hypothetical protein